MFGKLSKRKPKAIDSLIGGHTEVLGDIKISGGVHIDGSVRGSVTAQNDERAVLQLSEMGSIHGDVRVPFVVLDGVVVGDVHSTQHIDLKSKARVTGNVYYNLIEMAIGAEVNGKLVHRPDLEEPAVEFSPDGSFEPAD